MISIILKTPQEMLQTIAAKAKAKRLSLNLSQKTLAQHSGVSYASLKKFEQKGQISLESLLKIALCLEALSGFEALFPPKQIEEFSSLDELMKDNPRKRGRK